MLVVRNSRHHRRGQQAEIWDRLRQILQTLSAVASGRHHWRGKRRGHGHRKSVSRRHVRERYEPVARRSWLVKQEISASGLAIVVCVLLVSIGIGWSVVAQTAATDLARSQPDAALGFVADQPVALIRRAEQELAKPDANLDSAREWAQRALRASPLNARALTLLGLIAERNGDQKKADALMRIASARTWRDEITQPWLFNRDVGLGDYRDALMHADAMMRMYDEEQTEFFPRLAAFTIDPRAFEAMIAFLATSPPWRTWFLSQLSGRLANQARLVQLYAALSKTGQPPTAEELRPYLNRLILDENFGLAYQVWHEALPPAQRSDESHPFNRDFEFPINDLPFNWDLANIPGADIQIVSAADAGGKRRLLVEFSGARVHFANVKQLMLLPAGDYRFRGWVKTAELATSRGLWWHIFCANAAAETLATTELVSGTTPWTDFGVKFQVPATGCEAQWLRLELPARIESESSIEGQVWYQDLRITPVPAAAADAPLH